MVYVANQYDLDEVIDSFEAAHVAGDDVVVRDFLPKDDHPHYNEIAVELIRVDLEHRWRRGWRFRWMHTKRTSRRSLAMRRLLAM